jgi:hypothetical protein
MTTVDAHTTLMHLDAVDIAVTVCCQPHVELSALETSECRIDSYVHAVTPVSGALGLADPASLRAL